jgi:putative acetyltransferase
MSFTIRHAEPEDAAALQRIMTSPRVVWGTLQQPYQSVADRRKREGDRPPGWHHLVACTEDGEVVGELSLLANQRPRRNHVGEIGMAVRDDYAGQGVGWLVMDAVLGMADDWLGLTRIELTVWTDNEPAVRLYKTWGFEVEGTLRQYALREGRLVDAYCMARLRPAHD